MKAIRDGRRSSSCAVTIGYGRACEVSSSRTAAAGSPWARIWVDALDAASGLLAPRRSKAARSASVETTTSGEFLDMPGNARAVATTRNGT